MAIPGGRQVEAPRAVASIGGRKNALINERLPEPNAMLDVDFEDGHSYPADGSPAHEVRAVPTEVPFPFVVPRVEELCQCLRDRVEARDVRPLVVVARETGKGEVMLGGGPAVLLRDDVIDLVREVPEAMKPKKVIIGGQPTLQAVEDNQADAA